MKYTQLQESFNSGYTIDWNYQTNDTWEGTFMADDEEYLIRVSYEDSYYVNEPKDTRWFEIAFGISRDGFSGTKVIGTNNNQFKIFATIVKGFSEAIHALKPSHIIFSAYKGNRSRVSLYDRILRKIQPLIVEMGYTKAPMPNNEYINMEDLDDYKTYSFIRNN